MGTLIHNSNKKIETTLFNTKGIKYNHCYIDGGRNVEATQRTTAESPC